MKIQTKTTVTLKNVSPQQEHLLHSIMDLIEIDSVEAVQCIINNAIVRRIRETS